MMRQAAHDCKLPLTEVPLEKGSAVAIPVTGLHMDPQYFPEPDKFDPERFSEEAKAARPPMVYLPFGEGPRICIGNFNTSYTLTRTISFFKKSSYAICSFKNNY